MSQHNRKEFICQLYVEYYQDIFKFCLIRLKDVDLAKDCMQETYKIGIEKLMDSKEKIEKPKAWLTTIAYFCIKSQIKKRAIYNQRHMSLEKMQEEIAMSIADDFNVEERFIETWEEEELETAIKSNLSDMEYKLYVERFKKGISPSIIAKDMEKSYSAITSRMEHAYLCQGSLQDC